MTIKFISEIDVGLRLGLAFISIISVWEIATLVHRQRVSLSTSLTNWVNTALTQSGFTLVNLTPQIVVESYSLPTDFHGDPGDRTLTGTARVEDFTLLTRDENILQFAKQGYVRARKV